MGSTGQTLLVALEAQGRLSNFVSIQSVLEFAGYASPEQHDISAWRMAPRLGGRNSSPQFSVFLVKNFEQGNRICRTPCSGQVPRGTLARRIVLN